MQNVIQSVRLENSEKLYKDFDNIREVHYNGYLSSHIRSARKSGNFGTVQTLILK